MYQRNTGVVSHRCRSKLSSVRCTNYLPYTCLKRLQSLFSHPNTTPPAARRPHPHIIITKKETDFFLIFLSSSSCYLDSASAAASSLTNDGVNPARFFSTFSINASPALYELRTSGPLAQYRNPNSSARWRHCSNTAGGTYSCTFMWRFVGCMYCPKVTTSTLAVRSSGVRGLVCLVE